MITTVQTPSPPARIVPIISNDPGQGAAFGLMMENPDDADMVALPNDMGSTSPLALMVPPTVSMNLNRVPMPLADEKTADTVETDSAEVIATENQPQTEAAVERDPISPVTANALPLPNTPATIGAQDIPAAERAFALTKHNTITPIVTKPAGDPIETAPPPSAPSPQLNRNITAAQSSPVNTLPRPISLTPLLGDRAADVTSNKPDVMAYSRDLRALSGTVMQAIRGPAKIMADLPLYPSPQEIPTQTDPMLNSVTLPEKLISAKSDPQIALPQPDPMHGVAQPTEAARLTATPIESQRETLSISSPDARIAAPTQPVIAGQSAPSGAQNGTHIQSPPASAVAFQPTPPPLQMVSPETYGPIRPALVPKPTTDAIVADPLAAQMFSVLPDERISSMAVHPAVQSVATLTAAPTANALTHQFVQHAGDAASGPVEIILQPEELGAVKFQIHQNGDSVRVVLMVERSETLDMMRRYSDQLVQEFRQAGFTGASLSFGQWTQQDKPQNQQPQTPDTDHLLPDVPQPRLRQIALTLTSHAQGLNLRL